MENQIAATFRRGKKRFLNLRHHRGEKISVDIVKKINQQQKRESRSGFSGKAVTAHVAFRSRRISIRPTRECLLAKSEKRYASGYPDCAHRGRGRRGGRAVSGRGRKRRRGPSGGGTLRRKSPQQGQRPSLPMGLVASARNQWPRASQSGLMHCTVKPGKY